MILWKGVGATMIVYIKLGCFGRYRPKISTPLVAYKTLHSSDYSHKYYSWLPLNLKPKGNYNTKYIQPPLQFMLHPHQKAEQMLKRPIGSTILRVGGAAHFGPFTKPNFQNIQLTEWFGSTHPKPSVSSIDPTLIWKIHKAKKAHKNKIEPIIMMTCVCM